MKLTIVLPLNPVALSVNQRYRSNDVVPPAVRKTQGDIVTVVRAEANRQGFAIGSGQTVRLRMIFTFPGKRGDLDNPLKRTIDAVARALGFNDAQVAELHIYRQIGDGQIEIEIDPVQRGNGHGDFAG